MNNGWIGSHCFGACGKGERHGGEYILDKAAHLMAARKWKERTGLASLYPLGAHPQGPNFLLQGPTS
jgi:hypothetical protein